MGTLAAAEIKVLCIFNGLGKIRILYVNTAINTLLPGRQRRPRIQTDNTHSAVTAGQNEQDGLECFSIVHYTATGANPMIKARLLRDCILNYGMNSIPHLQKK